MTTLYCSNGKNCDSGREIEDDNGVTRKIPAVSYSQDARPMYHGLCLNCLDDYNRELPFLQEQADDYFNGH